ncbi:FtsB family cell division protein [Anaerosolibacter sp.]|uniref:FtsB family cell division protein n=1 Tax=Anaerosolibacter sp. TaxID=1872527 RepID=UPI0039EDF9CC
MDTIEQKKKRIRKGNRPFYMILLVVGLYVAWVFVDQQIRLHALTEQEEVYKSKVEQLKQEIARREEEVKNANTPEFIEKVAREQLKMIKPNEIIYIDMHKSKYSQ